MIKNWSLRNLPGQNASDGTPENMRRICNESYFVLKDFFDGVPSDVFLDGFGDLFVNKKSSKQEFLEIEKAFLYLTDNRWAFHIYNLIGLEKIYWLLNNQPYREVMIGNYEFDDHAFHALGAKIGAFDPTTSGGGLSSVSGDILKAELVRRSTLRSPKWLQPIINRIFRKYREGV